MIGRGIYGRPWLARSLETALNDNLPMPNMDLAQTADILLEDSVFWNSALAEVQCNAESGSAPAQRFVIRRCKITNPSFAVNMLGAQSVVIEASQIKSDRKSISADRPYGRPWPSSIALTGGTTCVGKMYVGNGSKVVKQ